MSDVSGIKLIVDKSPEESVSLSNRAVVGTTQPGFGASPYAFVVGSNNCYLTVATDPRVLGGKVALNAKQREWLGVTDGKTLSLEPVSIPKASSLIGNLSLEVDFNKVPKKSMPAIDTDDLSAQFVSLYRDNVFCNKQKMVLKYAKIMLEATVLQMTAEMGLRGGGGKSDKKVAFGILHTNTRIIFEKKPESTIQLIGRSVGDSAHTALISPDWDFKQMGIGGLDKEFSDIFRRAFASRVFPPDVVEEMGMKHVRGILLYGPPGCGKTLMARQIGNMLHAREPKVINGPEVLNKYVGESEANIRLLFKEAEDEQKKMGINSALHIIIFDELDAICRQRGTLSGSTGVHDTVVNQLLAKMDGVEQLNNILVIGMTNRKDMIDEALLRPGRLEVHMEIGLPDEGGRVEIFQIHTARMTKFKKMDPAVDLPELAKRTRNFTGAEIESVVRSAQATAMNRLIEAKDKVSVTKEDAEKLRVNMGDFSHALEFDVKPAFGISEEQLDNYAYNGILDWSSSIQSILEFGESAIKQTAESQRTPLVSILLRGNPGSGKTALAATIAKKSGFPYVKVITPENMVGFTESAKCQAVKNVFESAYKSELSCVVIDDIERLLDYVAIGPRFSNLVLQAMLVLLRKIPPVVSGKHPHKLLIIGTSSFKDDVLELTGISDAFNSSIEVPYLTTGDDVLAVLKDPSLYQFSTGELKELEKRLSGKRCHIGIKKLLSLVEAAKQVKDHVQDLIRRLELEAMLSK